ncbi:hypothetical protein [Kitasatospora aureofaciens]|uniref:hypothetical protein n=1 Tax=Kitasatospora aureofaciens TaxID=1894 RepID=UPI001C473AD3|nr:hypothetical protein [Kitasatospora aureofaciens]MBV6699433.1 hypothetical protein [Kitasatospora aureofaciens]
MVTVVTVVTVVSVVDAVGSWEGESPLVAVECLHHEERVLPEEVTNLPLILVAGLGGIIHVQIR